MFQIKNRVKFWKFVVVVVLAIAALTIALPGLPYLKVGGWNLGEKISTLKIRLGLDLQGGTHLVYQADLSQVDPKEYTSSLEGVRDVIERRINAFGIAEPVVQTSKTGNNYKVIVDLAGVKDVTQAIKMIGETPTLDFREPRNPDEAKLTDEQKQAVQKNNQEKLDLANKVLAQAKAGGDFAALAKQYSDDPGSKDKGGDLDFFKKGEMVPEFDAVAFNPDFKVGDVWPELVKSQYGYHIIKKTDQRGDGDTLEVKCSHILFATQNEDYDEHLLQSQPYKQTGLTGKQLERADVVFDPNTGEPEVSLTFNSEGRDLFRDITTRNLGKRVPIYLDGEPITMPVIKSVIPDGKAVISGNFTVDSAKQLQQRLNEGALPVPISLVQQQTVGASLGQESLDRSLIAGIVGFILVAFFMIAIFRWPGIIAVIALGIYTLLLVSIFKLLGITLTLSGIAGLILSIGMAVDANVLVFSRMREEFFSGKPKSVAISEGFRRAWPSIRDGNTSTIITCFVLIFFGTGMVKGFAIALVTGVFLSIFTAIFVTRTIMEFLIRNDKIGFWWGMKNN
jgi:protein-export membrane protein SecD